MSTFARYYLPAESSSGNAARKRAQLAISDVAMFHEADGGNIALVNGEPVMSDGLFNFVYLSLFGGNDDDPGLADTSKMWWGNFGELEPARWLRSETQYLLNTLAPNTFNLRRIDAAVKNDLSVMMTEGIARSLQTAVSLPAPKSIRIDVNVEVAPGVVERFNFDKNWSPKT